MFFQTSRDPRPPLERESLREQIGRSLRSSLFSGEMLPGETFSVPALAQEFGVSATPVREAVLDLVRQGLVVVLPNKGYRVAYTSPKEMFENIEIRRLIEVPATIDVASSISSEDLAVLREMAIEILEFAHEKNVKGFVTVDYEFHWYLLNIKGNGTLTDLVEDLRSRARIQAVPLIARAGRMVETAQEHIHLLDAMECRDFANVERIVLLHMSHAVDGMDDSERISPGIA